MAFKSTFSISMILMICVFSAQAQDIRLSYDLDRKQAMSLDIKIMQNTSSEASSSAEISISSSMKLLFMVDSLDGMGNIHLNAAYSNLSFSMLAPSLGLDMNSEDGQSTVLQSIMDSLQDQKFRLGIKASGELIYLEGIDEIFRNLERREVADSLEKKLVLQSLSEAYGEDAFSGLVSLFLAFYPNVQPIKNWTRDITYYFNTKPVKMVNRYVHAKSTPTELTIQGMGMLNSMKPYIETIELGKVESYLDGHQTFDFIVNRESGWLKQCVCRQRVLIEATILESKSLPRGLKIPSYTETIFEVKGQIEP